MKVKNLVLFGFVLSALSYLNEQAKDENNNDFDFLNNLENVDLDKVRKEFGDGLENVVGEFGDVVSSIVKIGSEAFDRYLQNYENNGEDAVKTAPAPVEETKEEEDEEIPIRSFFEEKEPDNWPVDLDAFLHGGIEAENNVLADLTTLLNALDAAQTEQEKTEEDYLREIEEAIGAQQEEAETEPEETEEEEPLMPEMSDAESNEIDALLSEIIAGEKAEEEERTIPILDGFEEVEAPAEENEEAPAAEYEPEHEPEETATEEVPEETVTEEVPAEEEPAEEVPAEITEEEVPAEEEAPAEAEPEETTAEEIPAEEAPEEEPVSEEEHTIPIMDGFEGVEAPEEKEEVPEETVTEEVPTEEEPAETVPEEITEEEAPAEEETPAEAEPEEIPAEEEPAERLAPVQEEIDEGVRSESIIEEASRYVRDLVADLEEELTLLEEEYRKVSAPVEEPAIEERTHIETGSEEPAEEAPDAEEEPEHEPEETATEEVPEETVTEEVPAEEEPAEEAPAEITEEEAPAEEETPSEAEPEETPAEEEPAAEEETAEQTGPEPEEEAPEEEFPEAEPADEYEDNEDRNEIRIEEAPRYEEEDIYAKINDLYPYLSLGFIRSVYELKEVIAEEYPLDKEVIVLHRIRFASVDDLRQFVEIVSNHGYNVNVDENQLIADIFKQYRNTDGRILTNIFEIANQAKLLRGQYEGYRIDVTGQED